MSLDSETSERIVLGRNTPWGMVKFQWTGSEPNGMSDTDIATDCGAVWEGDELVTYNLGAFQHNWAHKVDGYMEDSD